jgi:hypothetical protein
VYCPITNVNPMVLLFNNSNNIFCFEDQKTPPRIYYPAELTSSQRQLYQFFIINPIKPNSGTWKKEAVESVYNFLLESDTISISSMLRFLNSEYCLLKPRIAVYSGGKSIHCIYSLAAPIAKEAYRGAFYALQKELTAQYRKFDPTCGQKVFDSSNSNYNRLSRMPGGTRDNGSVQQVLLTGPLLSGDELEELTRKYPYRSNLTVKIKLDRRTINTLADFENWVFKDFTCPISIQKWSRPLSWMSNANNRNIIFKDCLYIYDLLNVSPDILLQFMERYWTEALNTVGYHRDMRSITHGSYEYHSSKSNTPE